MADLYHYDKDNKYAGKTSDKPPPDGGAGCAAVIVIVLIFMALGKCSSSNSPAQSSNNQTYTAPTQPAEQSAPVEPSVQPYEPPSNDSGQQWDIKD